MEEALLRVRTSPRCPSLSSLHLDLLPLPPPLSPSPDQALSPSNPPIKLHQPTLPTSPPELLLQPPHLDALSLRKGAQGQGQRKHARCENQAQIDREHEPGPLPQPGLLLQLQEDEGRDHHDGGGVEDARDGGLGDGVKGGGAGFAQGLRFAGGEVVVQFGRRKRRRWRR